MPSPVPSPVQPSGRRVRRRLAVRSRACGASLRCVLSRGTDMTVHSQCGVLLTLTLTPILTLTQTSLRTHWAASC